MNHLVLKTTKNLGLKIAIPLLSLLILVGCNCEMNNPTDPEPGVFYTITNTYQIEVFTNVKQYSNNSALLFTTSNHFESVDFVTSGSTNLLIRSGITIGASTMSNLLGTAILTNTTLSSSVSNSNALSNNVVFAITNNFITNSDLSNQVLVDVVAGTMAVTLNIMTNTDDIASGTLAGYDLRGLNFSNYNLSNANLSNVNLSNADLRGATITDINLMGAENTEHARWGLDFTNFEVFVDIITIERTAHGIWSDGITMWAIGLNRAIIRPYPFSNKIIDTNNIDLTLDNLDLVDSANDIWSDGNIIWFSTGTDSDDLLALNFNGDRVSNQDFNTLLAAGNNKPFGIWSDGTTMWVSDWSDDKIYAYNMSDKQRKADQDFDTLSAAGNNNPYCIWSDGTTMWVVDRDDDKIYAYNMSDKQRNSDEDLNISTESTDPWGLWSDGTTMWVSDNVDRKIYAYNLRAKVRTP